MKFLVYLLLSYLVYQWFLKPLFAGPSHNDSLGNRRQEPIQDTTRQQATGNNKSSEGEYIDYEEIE